MATTFFETYATDSGANTNGGTGGSVVSFPGAIQTGTNQATVSGTDLSAISAAGSMLAHIGPTGITAPCVHGIVTAVDNTAKTVDWSSTKKMTSSGNGSCVLSFGGQGANNGTTFRTLQGHTVTRVGTNIVTSTTRSIYGGSSLSFTSTADGNYLTIPHSTDWDLAAGDFWLEWWGYGQSGGPATDEYCVMMHWGTTDPLRGWGCGYCDKSSGVYGKSIWFTYSLTGSFGGGQYDKYIGGLTIAQDTWYHYAIGRSGNTLYFFLDGTLVGTKAMTHTIYNPSTPLVIGSYGLQTALPQLHMQGNLAGLRVVKGQCEHTTSFTRPGSLDTITIGGEWKNPQGAIAWPLDQSGLGALSDSAGHRVRCNLKGTSTLTSGIVGATTATTPVRVEGYTTSPGDEGHWTVTSAAAINVITLGTAGELLHTNVVSTATTGNGSGVVLSGTNAEVHSCNIHGHLGMGIYSSSGGGGSAITGNEIYDCGKSNTSGYAAILLGSSASGAHLARNKVRDCSGSNIAGIRVSRAAVMEDNHLSAMGAEGIVITPSTAERFVVKSNYLDSNGSHGIKIDSTSAVVAANLDNNVVTSNTGTGIYGTGTNKRLGTATNNAFRANAAETSGLDCLCESGSITLTAAPYDGSGTPSDEITGTGLWDLDGVTNYPNVGPYYSAASGGSVFPVIGSSIVKTLGVWSNA